MFNEVDVDEMIAFKLRYFDKDKEIGSWDRFEGKGLSIKFSFGVLKLGEAGAGVVEEAVGRYLPRFLLIVEG